MLHRRNEYEPRRCGTTLSERGVTLVELVLAVVIIGVLVSVVTRGGAELFERARFEEARSELSALAQAISGNPTLVQNGQRTDFGYMGDVGSLPPNLDALVTNPGYATWQGPYLDHRSAQDPTDFKTDPWGALYAYLPDSLAIRAVGGSTSFRTSFGATYDEILRNEVTITIADRNGTPPDSADQATVVIQFMYPNGAGGTATQTGAISYFGRASFDSIPVGTHLLRVIYTPTSDTITRALTITPGSHLATSIRLPVEVW